MKLSPSQIKTIRHQFDSLCKKILREESFDIERRRAQRAENEISFSETYAPLLDQLFYTQEFPSEISCFDVLQYQITVKDERLAEALASLRNEERDIVLLSYFLDMNDREIAESLNMVKRTVQRRRSNSLKELKIRLEEVKDDGQDSE